jgi:putative transposase
MARLARIVAAGVPHHVTQRGNRREPIFFEDGDQDIYRHMLAEQARRHGVEVWAYCLMPNHVHLIMVPQVVEGLGRAMGEAHRRYTSFINARARWSGHLFQGRYASVAMDEAHLIAAVRYVSLNPVRAGLARTAADWPWSSARAHLNGQDDGLVQVRPVLDRVSRFSELIGSGAEVERRYDDAVKALRSSQATGRPLGTVDFVDDLERRLGRPLAPRTRGRKAQADGADQQGLL